MKIKQLFLIIIISISPILHAFSAYSNAELDQLEKSFIHLINQSDQVLRLPLADEYINHLAKRLSSNSGLSKPTIFIVKSNEINAFAGPGDYIGINSQLILSTQTESELAAVIAHEMAHIRQHHLYRMIEYQHEMRIPIMASILASLALGLVNPTLGSGAMMASLGGFSESSIHFTRSNEKEADHIGMNLLINAKLDPTAMAAFFKKMQLLTRYYYTDNILPILRTHPLDDDRIAEAENRSQNLKISQPEPNPDYALFKELIRNAVKSDAKNLIDYYRLMPKNQLDLSFNQYGYALALMRSNQFQKAQELLIPLIKNQNDKAFIVVALAHNALKMEQYPKALKLLTEFKSNYPDNYGITLEYANALVAANLKEEASKILFKAFRQFKDDLKICQMLAQTQSATHHKDLAYFTEASCHLLQGEYKAAINDLNLAKSLVQKDEILKQRIAAKLEEIKGFAS